ncbi:hypothetical protein SAMN05421730_1001489 [Anaerobium acetethylicum]|uniref:Uncharacterized protein n=1 Tax=Anaerobium acetethylicum TaxID=1619234 RepID=A0A1D3TPI2_9FIRM|nr:hypothetical protein SAMN05421730_1001489 [Anaerobium acetethylicum]
MEISRCKGAFERFRPNAANKKPAKSGRFFAVHCRKEGKAYEG